MSLWWAQKNQLDKDQVKLIETLRFDEDHLVKGPPGSGKTNVLLRRAQFGRFQGISNVLVLTFTRTLTEFVKTGCWDQGKEIFPSSCVLTLEEWIRDLYKRHKAGVLPTDSDYQEQKRQRATGAAELAQKKLIPQYDALFVDEVQDLLKEELELIQVWTKNVFFVGDDRQRIHDGTAGLGAIQSTFPSLHEHTLENHYRISPELCGMADKIMTSSSGVPLANTCHYMGPKPGSINRNGPIDATNQVQKLIEKLKDQLRVYGDFIEAGDKLGIIVDKKDHRDSLLVALEKDAALQGRVQIVRARTGEEDDRSYNPALDKNKPICLMTVKGCKGLEFRALHWVYVGELAHHYSPELLYTAVTRAKTSLDLYYADKLPDTFDRAYATPAAAAAVDWWG